MSDDRDPPIQSPPKPTALDRPRRIITTRGRSRSGDAVTLETWIQGARIDQDKDGPCTGFALAHRPTDKELHFVQLGGSPGRTDAELANVFLGVAQSYADGTSGVQSFELMAFYGRNEPEAFKPFQISGKTEFEGGATEPPDKTGQTAQGMRLTEMLVQGSFRAIETMHRASRDMMQDMGAENRDLRGENREMFKVLKELLIEREKLAHDRQMEEMQYKRQSEERAMWLKMAPPLVNSVMGKEVFPVSTADTALITAAVEHLSQEQLQLLSGVLPPEVWGPLATRMQQILEEKEKNRLRSVELAKLAAPVEVDDPMAGEK
jgi:hypothetical protein